MNILIYILIICFIVANIMFISFMLTGFKDFNSFNKTNDKNIYDNALKKFKYMAICGVVSFISLFICGSLIL